MRNVWIHPHTRAIHELHDVHHTFDENIAKYLTIITSLWSTEISTCSNVKKFNATTNALHLVSSDYSVEFIESRKKINSLDLDYYIDYVYLRLPSSSRDKY